jgi:ribose transport system permease protein
MLGLAIVLVLFVLLLAWKGKLTSFLSVGNLQVLMHTHSITAVLALGMLLIIISGGIDLSVGSVVALVTVVAMQTYLLLLKSGASATIASAGSVAAGLGVGGLTGLANGLAITRLRVTPFVATLGMMSIARGLAVWLSGGQTIAFPGARPEWIVLLARSSGGRYLFDPGVWSLFALAAVIALVLHSTVFGRYSYALGSNEAAARLCGVAVERMKVWIYFLAGLLTGWAGILVFAQGSGGDPTSSVGLELDVIAAVVIGGASLSGGQGNVSGTLMGVLILAVLENGVNVLGVALQVKFILIGAIVIINTALSQWERRRGE